jgi:hypothetical protein
VTVPEPDVTNCGGITVFMTVAHLAEAFNLPLTSHGAHDLTVHLLVAVPNRSYLEVHGFGFDRYIEQPIVIIEENVLARDWAVLEKVRVLVAATGHTRPVDTATDARGGASLPALQSLYDRHDRVLAIEHGTRFPRSTKP